MSKPKLVLMPDPKWTCQKQVVEMAEDILRSAKSGKIQSLCYVAERSDEQYESGSSRVDNQFSVSGYLFSLGMRVMGFHDKEGR